jgi:hypothetical protein
MTRKLYLLIIILSFTSTTLTGGSALNGLAATAHKRAKSNYSGQYSGPYTVESSAFGDQTGKFTLSIDKSGEVKGNAENYAIRKKADIFGSVSEDGDARLVLEWPDTTYTMKGTITKTKSGHLKGTLNQYAGKQVVAVIKMDLQPR